MEGSLLAFWAIVFVAIWVLKLRPESTIARAAFTWIGPRPIAGQTWATYQARWTVYSFGWLCQIALVCSGVWFVLARYPDAESHLWLQALFFGLPLGAGVALLATIGFMFTAAKARYIGPNPTCNPPPDDKLAV
jgi:hypothetical protein